jgi:outer membrane immunogenic protein
MTKRFTSPFAITTFILAASASAFAADLAVKAPPPAPVPTWTGFYAGIQIGGGWNDEAVNYSPIDPVSVSLFTSSA